ncbi:hypothetical protein E2562_015633 [Oryza meyeriana var. granulata]|uniref:CLAVATA3/ESR-like protein n=1 Tax=Oryza meyeriana var. granulata TaxID=110450 RepID=A0A6G1EKM4_9ORYZ|nr:hypothetical protein E2562_015633 [Oryza meyeriana var. granulata]
MAARTTGIVLLVILLVAVPEARRIVVPSPAPSGYSTSAAVEGWVAGGGARRPSKWNMRRALDGDKRTVPGGPDPQHHH